MTRKLTIGTRGSKLALAQAHTIAALLREAHPGLDVALEIITTRGDRVLDVALSAVGDKGLFVKELEQALLDGVVDLAVHSAKDLPSQLPEGLVLAAFPRREDPRDVLVLPVARPTPGDALVGHPFGLLPHGARVGTSSLRRACQLRALRPDLAVVDVRGNVDTRLRKLDSGEYDALVLAAAGLRRLGLEQRISAWLDPAHMLPAVAQGALAIEARADDQVVLDLLAALDHPPTRAAVLAERAFLRRLEGGCQVPIAGHALLQADGAVLLRGLVGAIDGSRIVAGERGGTVDAPEQLGDALAEELLMRGAAALLGARTAPDSAGASPQLPLTGRRVVITRAEDRAGRLAERLRALGAEPIISPTIAYAPPSDHAALDAALSRLLAGDYDWLVLTSAAGARFVGERLRALRAGLPADVRVAAVGPATAAACADWLGVAAALVPARYDAAALAEALGGAQGQRVLLANADIARPTLEEQLRSLGAAVERAIAYHTVPVRAVAVDLQGLLSADAIDAIIFTSGSTVHNFVRQLSGAALDRARQAAIVCIGPVTADAARVAGLPPTVVATQATEDGLIEALISALNLNTQSWGAYR